MKGLLRHKHLKLDQKKINKAKKYLGAKTDTEAIDRALEFIVAEKTIDATLGKLKGKIRIRKIFD